MLSHDQFGFTHRFRLWLTLYSFGLLPTWSVLTALIFFSFQFPVLRHLPVSSYKRKGKLFSDCSTCVCVCVCVWLLSIHHHHHQHHHFFSFHSDFCFLLNENDVFWIWNTYRSVKVCVSWQLQTFKVAYEDAKASKFHLKFSSLMMIFIKLVYLSSVISLK